MSNVSFSGLASRCQWALYAATLGMVAVAASCGSSETSNSNSATGGGTGQQPTCIPPMNYCAGACVNVTMDPANCGGCGQACPLGTACVDGKCACPGTLTRCQAGCVDVTADANNCGVCGSVCPAGSSCVTGACQCSSGLALCNGRCVNTVSDGMNCGTCGNVCPAGQVCSTSACNASCVVGLTQCGTDCVDTQTNASNCGTCGVQCPSGQCNSGACVGAPPTGTGGADAGTGGAPATGGTMEGVGGSATGGETSTTGGVPAETGGASPDATGGETGVAGAGPTPQQCAGSELPNAKTTIIDFTAFDASGSWGESEGDNAGLTGGTSKYSDSGSTIDYDVSTGAMVISATIAAGGYVGLTFWFGPCVDVSAYTGLSFSLGGTLDAESVSTKFQVQINADYPVDEENQKGACQWTSEDSKWSDCANPTFALTVPETPSAIEVPFADLSGGKPQDTVLPDQVIGLQFQFECSGDAACPIELSLDDIGFYPAS